ncbi:MAG: DUF177 domain-containing protein [Candidatus Neomarinimicrobiota bacterium]|nr:DUF177 domain-containing protein [Candidatus Neomarinimicrobiota bacterium]
MKLYRTDLEVGLKNKLIALAPESLRLNRVTKKIKCELSNEKSSSGFRIYGKIDTTINVSCDRCLKDYQNDLSSKLNIILTHNEEIIKEMSSDVIRFKNSDDFIDISNILRDIILLDEPIKKLCNNDCKGLCSNCGLNLNEKDCDCKKFESNQSLKELENLIN